MVTNTISYNAAISSCKKGHGWLLTFGLLSTIRGAKVVGHAYIHVSAPAVLLAVAPRYNGRPHSHWACSAPWQVPVAAKTSSYSAAISSCEQGPEWQLALGLLSTMAGAKWKELRTAAALQINSCEKGQEWQIALGLLSTMTGAKVVGRACIHASECRSSKRTPFLRFTRHTSTTALRGCAIKRGGRCRIYHSKMLSCLAP